MLGRVPDEWAAFIRPPLGTSLSTLMVVILILGIHRFPGQVMAVTIVPIKLVVVVLFHIAGVVGLYTLPTDIFLPLLGHFCDSFLKFLGSKRTGQDGSCRYVTKPISC